MNNLRPPKFKFAIYLLPGILLYVFAVFVPVLGALYYSMFDWMGGPKKTFAGLQNYVTLLHDETFWQALKNNLVLTMICIVGQIGIAFLMAMLLNTRYVKMKQFHRVVSYFPVTLSAVVIGFIWSMIYDYNYGLLNTLLGVFGMESLQQAWLSNRKLALFLVSLPLIWQYIGYYLVIILSGLSSIDPGVLEMAEIDGATGFQRARYITLPLIRGTLIVCLTLCISGNLKTFDHIYVMTGGGPGISTMVMSLYAYQNSFVRYKMGYGSAISIGILIISLLITLLSRRIAGGKGEKSGV
ncbi:sugar ABC transporter permease [Enterocloster sp. OA13]|uniref:carbohydrate ABC transporter permease n=1 Tax=Enterocloster sp. OA13 TaxID=2914161 RepID=UPI000472392C|nr:sugar ABC transporter permease [Enterocloster sp. OA13]